MSSTLEAPTQTTNAVSNYDIKSSSSISSRENKLSVADKNRQKVLTFQIEKMFTQNPQAALLLSKVVTNSTEITIQQTLDFRNLCSILSNTSESQIPNRLNQLMAEDNSTIEQVLENLKKQSAESGESSLKQIEEISMTSGPTFSKTYREGKLNLEKPSMINNSSTGVETMMDMQRERMESLPKQSKYSEKRYEEIEAKKAKGAFYKITSFWKSLWR